VSRRLRFLGIAGGILSEATSRQGEDLIIAVSPATAVVARLSSRTPNTSTDILVRWNRQTGEIQTESLPFGALAWHPCARTA
jgi:hypothetical protein